MESEPRPSPLQLRFLHDRKTAGLTQQKAVEAARAAAARLRTFKVRCNPRAHASPALNFARAAISRWHAAQSRRRRRPPQLGGHIK